MKIGDVEVKKIPAGQGIVCQNECPVNAIAYYNGTPYCAGCLREEQQMKWNEDGIFFVNREGERIHYEIVQRLS
jgi:hypothetical protein